MPRPKWHTAVVVLSAVVVTLVVRNQIMVYVSRETRKQEAEMRQELFDLLRPVALKQCRIERFGEPHDGGYMVCGNLLDAVQAGYSYGISGYDQWGCDVATKLKVPVHQYDCFNTTVPSCPAGRTVFHADCVAGTAKVEDGRTFNTIAAQLAANGDGDKRIVLKIDVEGSEWESFAALPDDVLRGIDQLVVEFHGTGGADYPDVVRRLTRFFHVAHFHANNASCQDGIEPFTSWAYEVLFVNKQLDEVDPAGSLLLPHPLDAKNAAAVPDCQPVRK